MANYNSKLEAVRQFLNRLKHDYGVVAVCAGGAARDTWFNREPKDYDIVVLTPVQDAPWIDWIGDASGFTCRDLTEHGSAKEYTGDDRGRELEAVIETGLRHDGGEDLLQVQVLVYTFSKTLSFDGNPREAVEEHDCDLNKIWFEDVGDRLMLRCAEGFPSHHTGNTNYFSLGVDAARKVYIEDKFPEINHK